MYVYDGEVQGVALSIWAITMCLTFSLYPHYCRGKVTQLLLTNISVQVWSACVNKMKLKWGFTPYQHSYGGPLIKVAV